MSGRSSQTFNGCNCTSTQNRHSQGAIIPIYARMRDHPPMLAGINGSINQLSYVPTIDRQTRQLSTRRTRTNTNRSLDLDAHPRRIHDRPIMMARRVNQVHAITMRQKSSSNIARSSEIRHRRITSPQQRELTPTINQRRIRHRLHRDMAHVISIGSTNARLDAGDASTPGPPELGDPPQT